uniref:Cyclin N-terminal domain-containing protein n=1 Tax=Cyprinus carpio TaxID=7962 RepID=A0A8C1Y5R2_CYPCA
MSPSTNKQTNFSTLNNLQMGQGFKLVSWLIAVHRRLKLSFKACCLAVNIMDCFLIMTSVAADCFQSLLIATKQVTQSTLSFSLIKQLCNLECLILLRLRFRLAAPTHAFSLDYFTCTTGHQTDGAWKWLACRVCELSLADCTFNKYMASVIVLCALKLAKDLLKTHSVQPRDSEAGSSKTLESLSIQEEKKCVSSWEQILEKFRWMLCSEWVPSE